nr:unnamed protein product [Meloidogyne enterolobii]
MHECVHDGLVIKRDNQGLLCWEYIDCKEKHLRIQKEMYNNYCGEKCSCPSWTNQCSFYYGPSVKNSTLKNKSVYEILNSQEVKAKLCKIESGDNCAKLRTIKEFNQIELYDGNKILVNDLNIIIEDLMENEYVCVGQGPVTGSAKFCENHHCNERGTQLCYYVRSEIAFLETSKEKIPIKAWGRVKIKTNEFLDKKENLICKKCELKCTKDGIEIKNEGKLNGIEICVNKKCVYKSFPDETEKMIFSKNILVNDYNVMTSFFRNGEKLKEIEIVCERQNVCVLIECTLCWEYLKNPHCYPEIAMITFGITLYLLTSTILMIFKIIKFVLKFLKILFIFKIKCIKWIGKVIIKDRSNKNRKDKNKTKEFNPKNLENSQLLPMKIMITIIIFYLIKDVKSLTSINAREESCTVNKLGERNCLFEEIIEINLNPHNQIVKILLNDHTGKLAGTIEIEVHYVEMICTKAIKFFSRTYQIKTMSVKRCYSEGSCVDNKCSELKTNEKIDELKDINKFPGITQCVESDGGWFQGCFYTVPACTYYRYYAIPSEKEILDIFTCDKWEPIIKINNKLIDSHGNITNSMFNLIPGRKVTNNKIEITLKDITMGLIPMLASTFVSNSKKIAKIDTETENNLRMFKCKSRTEAKTFLNCKIDPNICHCRPADNKVNCDCKELNNQSMIFKPENSLPFSHNGIMIKNKFGNIIAATEISSATLQFKLQGMKLKTEIELNKCLITNVSLYGCYECDEGAKVYLTCNTDFGKSLANIVCPSINMFTTCGPKGIDKVISINLNKAHIEEECEVFCGLHPTTFKLKGTLAATENKYIDFWNKVENKEKRIETKAFIHWLQQFDYTNLFFYLINPRYLFIFLCTLLILLILFYCCMPLLFRLMLKRGMQIFCARSVGDDGNHMKII